MSIELQVTVESKVATMQNPTCQMYAKVCHGHVYKEVISHIKLITVRIALNDRQI
jgi:hypothetical protein